MTAAPSEADVAAIVVRYLEEQGWEIYHEVAPFLGGARADIVGTIGHLVRVVEVKRSLTAALVEQAWNWTSWAHFVHVAVPTRKTYRRVAGRRVLLRACAELGIGILEVDEQGVVAIRETKPARLNRRAASNALRDCVGPQHQTWGRAGNADHEYWTPWRETVQAWQRYVRHHPGCTLKEIIEREAHHYHADSTARSCLARYLRDGVIGGIETRRGPRNAIHLYPAGYFEEETP